jgi:hypothetical protein
MITAVLLVFGVFFANFLTLFCVYQWYKRQKAIVIGTIRAYFEPQGDKPSEFTGTIDQLSARFAQAVVRAVKAHLANSASIDSRQASAIEGDLITDIASGSSPIAGALLDQFPALKKRLAKNPALAQMALNMLSKVGTGQPAPAKASPPSNGNGGMTI